MLQSISPLLYLKPYLIRAYDLSVGIASCTVPVYVSECSAARMRGKLVSLMNMAITFGQFTSGLTAGTFCPVEGGWR